MSRARDEFEPAIDIGAELAVGVVAQGSSQPRRKKICTSHHRTACCHQNVLSHCRGAPAFLLDKRFAALVGHRALHGKKRHRLVAGCRRIVEVVTDGAERARHHNPSGVRPPRRLEHVAGAENIVLEHVPAMSAVAFYSRDLCRNMIDALTASERPPDGFQIPDVTEYALHIEAFQPLIVVLVPQQHPDPHAVIKQPAHEIGTDMPGRAGDEDRRQLRHRRRPDTTPRNHSGASRIPVDRRPEPPRFVQEPSSL